MNTAFVLVVTFCCSTLLTSVSFSTEIFGAIEQAKAGADAKFYAATGQPARLVPPTHQPLSSESELPQPAPPVEDDQTFLTRLVGFIKSHPEFPYSCDKQNEEKGIVTTEPIILADGLAKYIGQYYENGKFPIFSNVFTIVRTITQKVQKQDGTSDQKQDKKKYVHFAHIARNDKLHIIIIGNTLVGQAADGQIIGESNTYLIKDGIPTYAFADKFVLDEKNIPKVDDKGKWIIKYDVIDFAGYPEELGDWKKHLARHATPTTTQSGITNPIAATPTSAQAK